MAPSGGSVAAGCVQQRNRLRLSTSVHVMMLLRRLLVVLLMLLLLLLLLMLLLLKLQVLL